MIFNPRRKRPPRDWPQVDREMPAPMRSNLEELFELVSVVRRPPAKHKGNGGDGPAIPVIKPK